MDPQLKITGDGSHTLWLPHIDETYHSTHGAIQESQYVFLKQGLSYQIQRASLTQASILEIGFGTGLNAWLTAIFATENKVPIFYTSLEPFPLSVEVIQQLNYTESFEAYKQLFYELHQGTWEQSLEISPQFTLHKALQKIEQWSDEHLYDVVYFDAFAPSKQPEIWSKVVLNRLHGFLKPNGILVTYCAQGKFKRTLLECGFQVESLPGPPGKKEMTRGLKT